MKNFSDRLLMMLSNSGLLQNEFAAKVGIDSTSVKNYLKGRTPQHSVLGKIIAAFPEYNREWIALGIGPMLVGGPEPTDTVVARAVTPQQQASSPLYEQMFEFLKVQITQKDTEIERLLNIMERQSQSLAKFRVRPLGTARMILSRGEFNTGGLTMQG